MRKHFLFTVFAGLMTMTAFATTIGPQSVKVTFNNGTNKEGWKASNGEDKMSVAEGVANVQMSQSGENWRADFQHQTSGTYTFNKISDAVWAIKLTSALPGEQNSRKFEILYNDGSSDHWINGISGPSDALDCEDGGKIYYFDLTTISAKIDKTAQSAGTPFDYASFTDATLAVKKIHFIFADATKLTEETAKYSVDWVATFTSVNDLKNFVNWKDEQTDFSEPFYEACFRPHASNNTYDNGYPRNGFSNNEFEGNYQARLFAVEYFLVDDFSEDKYYTFSVASTGSNNADLSIWNLNKMPYEANSSTSADDIRTIANGVVGFGPGHTGEGVANTALASIARDGTDGKWKFVVKGDQLSPLGMFESKTLIGLFVTSKTLKENSSAKFASCANTTKAHPSFAATPIVNSTQAKAESSLADAITNANANDVIVLSENATVSSQLSIAKALTIQGAIGSERIICDVPANTQLVLANDNTSDYTVNFKNLIVDGQNTERSIQTFDSNNKGQFCFEDVNIINTKYSVVTGDVKPNSREVVLKGNNAFKTGIYLNSGKRVKHDGASHTKPMRLILHGDYAADYAIVLTCDDPSKYEAIDALDATGWALYHAISGDKHELKGKKVIHYTLNVSPVAKMATMVIGFDAELPYGVKAYQLEYNGSEYAGEICAYDLDRIEKNKPVLIIADAGSYVFNGEEGATLDEQADPTYGALKGVYASGTVPACTTGVYNYILTSGNDGVGFYQVADATNAIGAHRAYLSCSYNTQAGGASAPRRMVINFDAHKTPTAVDQITNDQSPITNKVLINGVIYIRKADHLYRIDGQLVK